MNWSKVKTRSPLAYQEFMEWTGGEDHPHGFDLRILYDFFDAREVYISIERKYQQNWEVRIKTHPPEGGFTTTAVNSGHLTRNHAEQIAFLFGFQMLEQMLVMKEKNPVSDPR